MKKVNTFEDFIRQYCKEILRGDCCYVKDELLVYAFMNELKYCEKRCVKKSQTNHKDFLYYIAYNGRLARVRITGRKPIGLHYLKKGLIYKDSYGIYRSDYVLDKGQIIKHRPIIAEMNRKWNDRYVDRISNYLDGGKTCTMIIDRDFATAYEPDYHRDFCLEGDLVTGTSCMSGNADAAQRFYGGIDGCKVARFENEDGEQVGRCLLYEYNGIRHFIRIYCQPDYGRCALSLLRQEMKEGDLFGRDNYIDGMCLTTDWDESTETLYLDGNYYGVKYDEGHGCFCVVEGDYMSSLGSTTLKDVEQMLNDNDWHKCKHCGRWEERDEGCWADYDFYCSKACAAEDGFVFCEHCGKLVGIGDAYHTGDGEYYCTKYCLSQDGYAVCDECGEIFSEDDMIEACGRTFCSDECAKSNGLIKCADCGEYARQGDVFMCPDGEYRCKYCGKNKGLHLEFVGEIETDETTTD